MTKKYLIISTVAVLLFIIGLSGWRYYKKIYSPTADWKTYTYDKYGFELRYPPTWQVVGDNPLTIREWPSVSKTGDYWLSVLIYKSDKSLKPEDIIDWVKKEYTGRSGYKLSNEITGYIDKKPAIQVLVEGTPQSPAGILTYVVKNNSEILEFGCLITPHLIDSNNLCDKILNSIKSIK